MSKATDTQVATFTRRNTELTRMFLSGERDQAYVLQALQEIAEGKFVLADRFGRYNDLLLSPGDQLARLREYNAKYWGLFFPEDVFASAEEQLALVPDDHQQSVDSLIGFHVQFGSFEETIEMWMRVYKGELPDAYLWETLKFDDKHFRLHKLARSYGSGIHLVHINLVAHWEPQTGRTIDEVRVAAEESSELLAQLEVMSIYGVLTQLFMEQDGENLPYTDMPGIEVTVPGNSASFAWRLVLCLYWSRGSQQGVCHARWTDIRYRSWAAPVVRELQN